MKVAKPVFRLGVFIGSKSCCMAERRIALSEEHKPYIRLKRSGMNLPHEYDTRFIEVKMYRSWKHRSKKKNQWEREKLTPDHWKLITGWYSEAYIIGIYSKNYWVKIQSEHYDDVEKLASEGKLEVIRMRDWRLWDTSPTHARMPV